MSLDTGRLENVHKRGGKTIARCPACAEQGHDTSGEHLVIDAQGRFGCVVHPGAHGREHRRRIAQIAGDNKPRVIAVRSVVPPSKTPITAGVLGRLQVVSTEPPEPGATDDTPRAELKSAVLNVPTFRENEKFEILGRKGRVSVISARIDEDNIHHRGPIECVQGVPNVPSAPAVSTVRIGSSRRRRLQPSVPELEEAVQLSSWLATVPLPTTFSLYDWARVIDAEKFRDYLSNDLSGKYGFARFRPAMEDARRLRQLFPESSS